MGGCIDLGEGSLPYGPVIQALRGLDWRPTTPPLVADVPRLRTGPLLARMLPELGSADDQADESTSASRGG